MSQVELEVTDSELMRLQEVIEDVNQKYKGRSPTTGNLTSMVHEMEDRCRALGFEVEMFLGTRLLKEVFDVDVEDPDGTLEEGVTFRLVSRTEEVPFDRERMKHEVDADIAGKWWERWRAKHAGDQMQQVPVEQARGEGGIVLPDGRMHGHEH